jgi:hypothetical protein
VHTPIPKAALVAHESLFGHTERLALAVAKRLGESLNVTAVNMSQTTVDWNPDTGRVGISLVGASVLGLPADGRVRCAAPLWRHLSLVEQA